MPQLRDHTTIESRIYGRRRGTTRGPLHKSRVLAQVKMSRLLPLTDQCGEDRT